ncbi:HGxxPAAW family protein [Sanguibacter suarezii]|uniref:HGxxPAAW family protein n=1 Tax=Sanguibacter suarezii TaxID=60921 RepID=UPI0008343E6B|nr:HGxxPAAW family protein [Sanguibacter suarezii]
MTDSSAQAPYLPPAAPPANHGHTVAAWFTTLTVVVGAILAGVALCISTMWLVWVGAAIVVVGLVGGKILSVAGYGQPAARGR